MADDTAPIVGPVQYDRKLSLMLTAPSGAALDLSELHVTFSISQNDLQTPNAADITVYNLAATTAQRIRREFTTVVIQAGYKANFGTIFSGEIKRARRGRQGVDNYLNIIGADGDIAYNFSIMNITLAAGSNAKDVFDACARAFALFNITFGPLPPDLPATTMPRMRALHGMTRDILRQLCNLLGLTWSIRNSVVLFVKQTGYIDGQTVILNAQTGLIGIPEQSQDSIKVVCLLNPRIYVGRLIQINNKVLNEAKFSAAYTGELANRLLPSTRDDGYYKVQAISYQGDTRGTDWYCTLECLAVDSSIIPPSLAAKGRVIDTSGGQAP